MRRYSEIGIDGKDIFVGVDVHLKQWHVTIRTSDEELFTGSIPGTWLALKRLLERYDPERTRVVYEAGYFGYSLSDTVLEWGGQAIVTPPSLLPMEYGNRVKTDKRDSRKLAFLLSCGLLRANWVPDYHQRCHRQVLRRRCQLEAAWVAIRRDPELQKVYRRTLSRSGSKRAIVAVARRLLLRSRRVLLDKRPYVIQKAA